MINQILQQIQSNFTDLAWVHKYANLTRIAKRETQQGTDTYPISCSVTNTDCWSKGKYKDLVPDAAFRSVAYWEQTSGIKPYTPNNRSRASRDMQFMEADVRLIVWFNLAGLGKEGCDFSQEALVDLLKVTKDQTFTTDTYKNIKIEFIEQDPKEVTQRLFQRYSYGSKEALFFYPYEIASYRFKIRFSVNPDCLDLSQVDDPIDCIDLSGVQIIEGNTRSTRLVMEQVHARWYMYPDKRWIGTNENYGFAHYSINEDRGTDTLPELQPNAKGIFVPNGATIKKVTVTGTKNNAQLTDLRIHYRLATDFAANDGTWSDEISTHDLDHGAIAEDVPFYMINELDKEVDRDCLLKIYVRENGEEYMSTTRYYYLTISVIIEI